MENGKSLFLPPNNFVVALGQAGMPVLHETAQTFLDSDCGLPAQLFADAAQI